MKKVNEKGLMEIEGASLKTVDFGIKGNISIFFQQIADFGDVSK